MAPTGPLAGLDVDRPYNRGYRDDLGRARGHDEHHGGTALVRQVPFRVIDFSQTLLICWEIVHSLEL